MTNIALDAIHENGHNIRHTPASEAQDAELEQSIRALGVLQPVLLRLDQDRDCYLIVAGHRRVRGARAAGLSEIPAEVLPNLSEGMYAAMQTAENVVRVPMDPVDQWRAMVTLQEAGYSIGQAGAALGISDRRARQLDKLGHIAPEILDIMIGAPLPDEATISVIASAPLKQQRQALKNSPSGWSANHRIDAISRGCQQGSIKRAFAIFDVETSKVVFEEDLFAEPGSDEQWVTTDVAGFVAAQKTALAERVASRAKKERVQLLEWSKSGLTIPKGFDQIWGNRSIKKRYPANGTEVLFMLVQETGYDIGKIVEVAATDRAAAKAAAVKKQAKANAAVTEQDDAADDSDIGAAETAQPEIDAPEASALSKRGQALMAEIKTAALRKRLKDGADDESLPLAALCMTLIVALASANVVINNSALRYGRVSFDDLARLIVGPAGDFLDLTEEQVASLAGMATARILRISDPATGIGSGDPAEWIGAAIGAEVALARFDTEEFLACMGKAALVALAAENGRTGLKTASGVRSALSGNLPDWRPATFGAPGPDPASELDIEDEQDEAA